MYQAGQVCGVAQQTGVAAYAWSVTQFCHTQSMQVHACYNYIFAWPETGSELITYLILSIEPSNTIHVKQIWGIM